MLICWGAFGLCMDGMSSFIIDYFEFSQSDSMPVLSQDHKHESLLMQNCNCPNFFSEVHTGTPLHCALLVATDPDRRTCESGSHTGYGSWVVWFGRAGHQESFFFN